LSAGSDIAVPLRILTLNAHQGLRAYTRRSLLPRLRDALREADADLVFLQEIGVARGSVEDASQYEVLADSVWQDHAYGRNAVAAGGHHGNALLSKLPILDWRNVDASVGRKEPRGFLHCSVDLGAGAAALQAICVHLALAEAHRRQQVGRLIDHVRSSVPADAPLLIAGDFNDWRGRAHRSLIEALGLEAACVGPDGRPPRTFPARWPLLRLDRIYARNVSHRPLALAPKAWSRLSDHLPLGCEIRF
jgi:endonuclease/exonuclease/phosphatase family metal-dependent hydrolase